MSSPALASISQWAVVLTTTVLLLFLTHVIFSVPGLNWIMPWLLAIGVFYWCLFRPDIFWPGQVFLLGFIEDCIVGTPLGLHALGLIILYRLALHQRQYLVGKPFRVIWVGFIINTAVVMGSLTLLAMLLKIQAAPWTFATGLTTCLIFPFVYLALTYTHLRLQDRVS